MNRKPPLTLFFVMVALVLGLTFAIPVAVAIYDIPLNSFWTR